MSNPPQQAGLGKAVAADISAGAGELLNGEQRQASLELRIKQAQFLHRDVTCYVAAVIQDARAAGVTWAEIATSAEVSEASARARWNETKTARLLGARPTTPARRPQSQRPVSGPALDWLFTRPSGPMQRAAGQTLQRYLMALSGRSPVTVGEAAHRTRLPDSAVAMTLAGDMVPSWPVTHMLVTIFGGCPEDLHGVWEMASGEAPLRWSQEDAGRRLQDVLHVLALASGGSGDGDRDLLAGLVPAPATPREAGAARPEWTVVEQAVSRLGVEPEVVRPFWQMWACADDEPVAQDDRSGAG
ncbi:hypothetical protein ACFWSJ_29275 [Streptomyces niveus]|uniref:hypothetical protein n=1 Tax=Streptomyces niveus TaxID=193462 RepID=UPI003646E400